MVKVLSAARSRPLVAAVTVAGTAGGLFLIVHFFSTLFGNGTWGTGGNMVAWVICGVLAFGWQRRQNLKLHNIHIELTRVQHQEAMDQAALRHDELKQHITNTVGS